MTTNIAPKESLMWLTLKREKQDLALLQTYSTGTIPNSFSETLINTGNKHHRLTTLDSCWQEKCDTIYLFICLFLRVALKQNSKVLLYSNHKHQIHKYLPHRQDENDFNMVILFHIYHLDANALDLKFPKFSFWLTRLHHFQGRFCHFILCPRPSFYLSRAKHSKIGLW